MMLTIRFKEGWQLYVIFISCLQTVALWDLRNLKLKLHSFESHKDEIFQVRNLLHLLKNRIMEYNVLNPV